MSTAGSKKVVFAALAGNLAIAIVKIGAALFTRSAALMAEVFHSAADSGNQVLLLVGMRLASRPPDSRHPFGYGKERYFWPFVVALTMFAMGSAFSIAEGVDKLRHPEPPHGGFWLGYLILGASIVFESLSCRVALVEYAKTRKGRGFLEAARLSRDPTIFVVVFEDVAALVGLVLAIAGLGLTQLTGNSAFDSWASISIGVLLSVVAVFIGVETRSLLIGESATPEEEAEIRRVASGLDGFVAFTELRTMHLAPDEVVVEAGVKFQDPLTVKDVRAWIDAFERDLRKVNPKITHVTVEPA